MCALWTHYRQQLMKGQDRSVLSIYPTASSPGCSITSLCTPEVTPRLHSRCFPSSPAPVSLTLLQITKQMNLLARDKWGKIVFEEDHLFKSHLTEYMLWSHSSPWEHVAKRRRITSGFSQAFKWQVPLHQCQYLQEASARIHTEASR